MSLTYDVSRRYFRILQDKELYRRTFEELNKLEDSLREDIREWDDYITEKYDKDPQCYGYRIFGGL